jgi:AcrR family transcriptional regulator
MHMRKPSRRAKASASPEAGTRERLWSAAAGEFARHGFAGASVDRIASAAGVNKAMIYYHFTSKAALYREILRDMFAAVDARVHAIVASGRSPADKIRDFAEAIALEAEARPHFPPIWFREIAEEGTHLDAATTAHIGGVIRGLRAILQEGVAAGAFTPLNPILLHAGIIGPMLIYFASPKLRARLERGGVKGAGQLTRDDVVAHVQRVALSMLEGQKP